MLRRRRTHRVDPRLVGIYAWAVRLLAAHEGQVAVTRYLRHVELMHGRAYVGCVLASLERGDGP